MTGSAADTGSKRPVDGYAWTMIGSAADTGSKRPVDGYAWTMIGSPTRTVSKYQAALSGLRLMQP